MRLHLVQTCSTNQKQQNLERILDHLDQLDLRANDFICLPENSLFMRATRKDPVEFFKIDDAELVRLQDWTKQRRVCLHLGAIALEIDGQVYNSCVRIHPDGSLHHDYQKIHLFDVDVVGQASIRESDSFRAGTKASIFTFNDWKIGQSICYDLRFPNLYQIYAKSRCDMILIPSAFLQVTGQAHWHVLVRARAIETQSYVVAPAQGGAHMGLHRTYGHSLIVDPWGEVVAEILGESDDVQSVCVELDKSKIEKVRNQIPLHAHRKSISQSN